MGKNFSPMAQRTKLSATELFHLRNILLWRAMTRPTSSIGWTGVQEFTYSSTGHSELRSLEYVLPARTITLPIVRILIYLLCELINDYYSIIKPTAILFIQTLNGTIHRYYSSIINYLLCVPGAARTISRLPGQVVTSSTNGIYIIPTHPCSQEEVKSTTLQRWDVLPSLLCRRALL